MQELVHWKNGRPRHHTIPGRLKCASRPKRVVYVAVSHEPPSSYLRLPWKFSHRRILMRFLDKNERANLTLRTNIRVVGNEFVRVQLFDSSSRSCLECTARHLP